MAPARSDWSSERVGLPVRLGVGAAGQRGHHDGPASVHSWRIPLWINSGPDLRKDFTHLLYIERAFDIMGL